MAWWSGNLKGWMKYQAKEREEEGEKGLKDGGEEKKEKGGVCTVGSKSVLNRKKRSIKSGRFNIVDPRFPEPKKLIMGV